MGKRRDRARATETFQMRVSKRWKRAASRSAKDRDLDLSTYVRTYIDYLSGMDRKAPYICEHASHFVYISAHGHLIYRRIERLKTNNDLNVINVSIPMKPGRVRALADQNNGDVRCIRNTWAYNRFSLWLSEPTTDSSALLVSYNDKDGVASKGAQLECPLAANTIVWRESLVVLHDYTLRRPNTCPRNIQKLGYDFVDFSCDITSKGETYLVLLLNTKIYTNTPGFKRTFHPSLRFIWRNRDLIPFTQEPYDDTNYPITKVASNLDASILQDQDNDNDIQTAAGTAHLNISYLHSLFRDENRDTLNDLCLEFATYPEDYLIYAAQLPLLLPDLVPSISWPLPAPLST